MKLYVVTVILSGLFLLGVPAPNEAFADGGSNTSATPTPVKIARDLIKQEKYAEALSGIRDALVKDAKNADLLSLAGFSSRRMRDLDQAYEYYNMALDIDPAHKGALNYLGILYVNTGQPEKAEALLERLDNACFFTCDEYTDLKNAIEAGEAPEW